MSIISSFDENLICEKCLNLNNDKFNKVLFQMTFGNNTTQVVLNCVIKYFLHQIKVAPNRAVEITKRYSIVLIYKFLDTKGLLDKLELRDRVFDFIIKDNTCSIYKKLIDETMKSIANSLIGDIYYKGGGGYMGRVKELKKRLKKYTRLSKDDDMNEKPLSKNENKAIVSILNKDYSFFHENRTSFVDIFRSDIRQFDMLVAEGMLNDKFTRFTIEIPDDQIESYKKNFVRINANACFNNLYPILFGYMINSMIEKQDYHFDNPADIIDASLLRLALEDRNVATSKKDHPCLMNFIKKDGEVYKGIIEPFKFKFNEKLYRFSKDGLEEL